MNAKRELIKISPHGFCAGVFRSVNILNAVLKKFKQKEIFVKHEIVHNKLIIKQFEKQKVKFIEDIKEVRRGSVLVASAHGVTKDFERQAKESDIIFFDATCPLVKNVHNFVEKCPKNHKIILIGDAKHPEIIGTIGRIEEASRCFIVNSKEDIDNLPINENEPVALATQTTLSILDTEYLVSHLKKKFLNSTTIGKSNICYATENRQRALLSIINDIDALIVNGSKNSSNSKKLMDIGKKNNKPVLLVDVYEEINKEWLQNFIKIGITAGASVPEYSLKEIIEKLQKEHNYSLKEYIYKEENTEFIMPKELRD